MLQPKSDIVSHKNKNFKLSKNEYFSNHGKKPIVLVKKWPFFQLFFLAHVGQENVFYDILELTKRLFRLKKQQVQKVEKLRFFQRG